MELEIEKNNNIGGYYAYFKYNDAYYFADLSFTFDCGNECMIFLSDENGVVADDGSSFCPYGKCYTCSCGIQICKHCGRIKK